MSKGIEKTNFDIIFLMLFSIMIFAGYTCCDLGVNGKSTYLAALHLVTFVAMWGVFLVIIMFTSISTAKEMMSFKNHELPRHLSTIKSYKIIKERLIDEWEHNQKLMCEEKEIEISEVLREKNIELQKAITMIHGFFICARDEITRYNNKLTRKQRISRNRLIGFLISNPFENKDYVDHSIYMG